MPSLFKVKRSPKLNKQYAQLYKPAVKYINRIMRRLETGNLKLCTEQCTARLHSCSSFVLLSSLVDTL